MIFTAEENSNAVKYFLSIVIILSMTFAGYFSYYFEGDIFQQTWLFIGITIIGVTVTSLFVLGLASCMYCLKDTINSNESREIETM